MNTSHLASALPGQSAMINLYGGPQQQQPPPFHPLPQQQGPQGPTAHPGLGMMHPTANHVGTPGGQPGLPHQMQQQSNLQHNTQQRMSMLQQRGMPPGAQGLMGHPAPQMQQGMFHPGMNPGMRRISPQNHPMPQGHGPMGLQSTGQMPSLRSGQQNTRMLGTQPSGQSHDMPHLIGMGRPPPPPQMQPPQMSQHPSMVNGMQSTPVPLPTPAGPMGKPSHPLPHHQQQSQHRPPQFQQANSMSPHHAPSPARPPSHHGHSPGNNVNSATPAPQGSQSVFPSSNTPHHQPHQPPPSQRPPGGVPFSFLPEGHPGQQAASNGPHSSAGPSNGVPATPSRLSQPPPFNIPHSQQGSTQEPFAHTLTHNTPRQAHRMLPGQQQSSVPGPSRPDTQPQAGPSRASPRPPSQAPQRPTLAQAPGHPPQSILPSSATSPISRRASEGLPNPSQQPPPSDPQTLPTVPGVPPRPQLPLPPYILGSGQGMCRVMEFSSCLADENSNRLAFEHWDEVTQNFFTPTTMWKLTLWKDNARREAKPFEIGAKVSAMLLHVSCQSGVRSMNLVLNSARERMLHPGTSFVECPSAQWIWRFYDGHVVILQGTFSCQISAYHDTEAPPDRPYTLKFDHLAFESNTHEKCIALNAIRGTRSLENIQRTPATTTQGSPDNASSSSNNTVKTEEGIDRAPDPDPRLVIEHAVLPSEPVNSFGIPQASMRCLELAESVGQMTELFDFCHTNGVGPNDGLEQLGDYIRSTFPPQAIPYYPGHIPPEHISFSFSLKENRSPGNEAIQPPASSSQPVPSATPTTSHPAVQPSPRPSGSAPKATPAVSAPSGPLKRKAQPAPEPSGSDAPPPAKRSMTTRRKSKPG